MSTKSGSFEKGEKVLCYEPDSTKAKILYNSKILGIYESKDKHGRKVYHYKVHFQGWSSSWDRKVSIDFLLKDNEINRQLQRELAEQAQLQLALCRDTYLYKKERRHNSKRRNKHTTAVAKVGETHASTTNANNSAYVKTMRSTGKRRLHAKKHNKNNDVEIDISAENALGGVDAAAEKQRVMFRISERLRELLEYDHYMVAQQGRQHMLPARLAVVSLLEHLVKENAVKLVSALTPVESSRRRATQQRADKREREFEKVVTTINLLKETADGLRIYFDHTLTEYLLYKHEHEYACSFLCDEYINKFSYVSTRSQADTHLPKLPDFSDAADYDPYNQSDMPYAAAGFDASAQKKSMYNTTFMQLQQPLTPNQHSKQMRFYLHSVLTWRILPRSAKAAPSMIFGAPHLARLLVRLPEFLNIIPMSEEKLKTILQHLESVANYLEDRNECFDESNYATNEFVEQRLREFRTSISYNIYKQQRRQQIQQRQLVLRQQQKQRSKEKREKKKILHKKKQQQQQQQQKRQQLRKKKIEQQEAEQELMHKDMVTQLQQQQDQLLQQQEHLYRVQMHLKIRQELQQRQLQDKGETQNLLMWQQFQEKEQQVQQQQAAVVHFANENQYHEYNDVEEYQQQEGCDLMIQEYEEEVQCAEAQIVPAIATAITDNFIAEQQQQQQQQAEKTNEHEVELQQQSKSTNQRATQHHHHHHRQYKQQYQVLQEPISPSQQDHPQLKIRIKTSRVVS